jgi:hypothetical protein
MIGGDGVQCNMHGAPAETCRVPAEIRPKSAEAKRAIRANAVQFVRPLVCSCKSR